MIKVSIVIPVFNLERFIGETLDSCLAQDISTDEYEIICVDDGSTDGTEAILADYHFKNPMISVYRTENSGVSHARNFGLSKARGEYVWFVDGDDLIKENCIKKLYSSVSDHKGDILWFRMKPFTTEIPASENDTDGFLSCNRREDIYKFMFSKGGGGVCVHFFRRDFLIEHGIRFKEGMRYSEDVLFGFECIMKASVCVKTAGVYYFYRQRSGSAMHSSRIELHMDSMEKLAYAYNSLMDGEQEEYRKCIIRNKRDFAVRALLFSAMQVGDVDLAKEKITKLKKEGFYPYPFKKEMLFGNETIKQFFINLFSFLFPIKVYYMFCVRVFRIKRRLSR